MVKMMSRGVSVAVVVLVLVVAVTAEPGFKVKGRCRPHVQYVPVYKTVYNKVNLTSLLLTWQNILCAEGPQLLSGGPS